MLRSGETNSVGGAGLQQALEGVSVSIGRHRAELPGVQKRLQSLEQLGVGVVEADDLVHLQVGALQQHALQWASVEEAPLDAVAAQQELVAGVEVALQEARRRQQELLEGAEAVRQLVLEQGQELAGALEHARRCQVELLVERHRRYNLQSNSSRLLALPLEVQQGIFHRVGREVREVCEAARACYGPPGSGVEVQVPAPEDMLRQLQAWPRADAVRRLRVIHTPRFSRNDPTIPIVASALPQLLELACMGPFGTSLQLLPTTVTRVFLVGHSEHMEHVTHLTALRSLQVDRGQGEHDLALLRNFPALSTLAFSDGCTRSIEHPGAFLAGLPSLQRLALHRVQGRIRPADLQPLTCLTHLGIDDQMLAAPEDPLGGPPLLPSSLASLTLRCGRTLAAGHDLRQTLQGLPLQTLQLLQVRNTSILQSNLPDTSKMPTLTSLTVDLSDGNAHLDPRNVADADAPFATTPCCVTTFSLRGALSAMSTTLDGMPAMLPHLTDLRLEFIFVNYRSGPRAAFKSVSRLTQLERLALHSHDIPLSFISHLSSLSRLSYLDLTQPRADHLPLLPLLTQLQRLKLSLYPLQLYQLRQRPRGRTSDRRGFKLCVDTGSCLDAARQMRGLTELDLTGLAEEGQQLGLECLLPVPVLLQRVRVSREARAEALAVLGPHVDHISSS